MPVIEPTKLVDVEPGIYSARITSIEAETHEEYGPQLKFSFTLLDGEGEDSDAEKWAWAGAKWNPKSKLYEWASTILGKKCPSPEEPFDYDALMGKRCDVKIENVRNKAGQERSALTKVYPFKSMNRADDSEE